MIIQKHAERWKVRVIPQARSHYGMPCLPVSALLLYTTVLFKVFFGVTFFKFLYFPLMISVASKYKAEALADVPKHLREKIHVLDKLRSGMG